MARVQTCIRAAVVALLASLVAVVVSPVPVSAASDDQPNVPTPRVTGPVTGGIHGNALWDTPFDLAEVGYEQAEYFVSGTAASKQDPSVTAEYTTRMIVTRPSDPADFSGTVLLDWTNVTAQFENPVVILNAMPFLLREGWAFVHVSAQAAGVCCTPLTPQVWDPVRYAPLDHPGDEYANAMFSQLAMSFHADAEAGARGVDPMGGLVVERILAGGQSQSANRLSDYVATEQPTANVIDGFLVQAEGNKQYAEAPTAPVLHLLGDREATPDDPAPWPTYRLWEIAGASHQDLWVGTQQVLGQGPRLVGPRRPFSDLEAIWETYGTYGERPDLLQNVCVVAGAAFPNRYAVDAALHALDRWVRPGGQAPPNGPRYQFAQDGTLAADALGNTLGGIRLPPIEVPVARYVSTLCNLGGITVPFTDLELTQRYPTHADYHAQMVVATERSLADGFLLPADADDLLRRACEARTRWGEQPGECVVPAPAPAPDPPGAPSSVPPPSDSGDPGPAPAPVPQGTDATGQPLPATGGGAGLVASTLLVAAVRLRRRVRTP